MWTCLRPACCPLVATCLSHRVGSLYCIPWANPLWPIATWGYYLHRLVLWLQLQSLLSFLVWTPSLCCKPALSTFPHPHSCLPKLRLTHLANPFTNAVTQLPCWMWLSAECRGIFYLDTSRAPSSTHLPQETGKRQGSWRRTSVSSDFLVLSMTHCGSRGHVSYLFLCPICLLPRGHTSSWDSGSKASSPTRKDPKVYFPSHLHPTDR